MTNNSTKHSSDCASSIEVNPCQAITALATLVASPAVDCKLAVLLYKVWSMSTPVYQRRRIAERACSQSLHSSAILLLDQPFMRTDFSRHIFQFSASSACNSLPQTVLISDFLSVFKSRLKTFLFNQAFTED